MLIVVGTYSETLGHVDGKGRGLYVLNVEYDDKDRSLVVRSEPPGPRRSFFGSPQLGGRLANPTYVDAYRDPRTNEVHLYVVDERYDRPGTLSAVRLDEDTGELTFLGDPVAADDDPKGDGGAGAACCHVTVSPGGGYVLAANYASGSIVAARRNGGDGSLDASNVQRLRLPPKYLEEDGVVSYPGPNERRQERSHAHMVLFSHGRSGKTTVLVPDLGSDVVWSIPFDPSRDPDAPLGRPIPTARCSSLEGGGPRHLAFHPNGRVVYVVYELTSQAACFELDAETGEIAAMMAGNEPLDVVNVLDGIDAGAGGGEEDEGGSSDGRRGGKYRGLLLLRDPPPDGGGGGGGAPPPPPTVPDDRSTIAAARVASDGSRLVVSNRLVNDEGAVSFVPLDAASGKFRRTELTSIVGTMGRTPRDFVLVVVGDGDEKESVLVANQDTDSIVLLAEGGGGGERKILTEDVPTPVSLCVVPPPTTL